MKNAAEIVTFWTDAERVAAGIAEDHGVQLEEATRVWCVAPLLLPPSLASGAGSLTEGIFFCVQFVIEARVAEVRRTRKFTIYSEQGREEYPSAEMIVRSSSSMRPGCATGQIAFFLQVANRMSASWGRVAEWRDDNLLRVVSDAVDQIETMPLRCWTEEEDTWLLGWNLPVK